MKKLLLAMFVLSAVFFSCKEKDSGSSNMKSQKQAAPARQSAESLIIYTGWDLYEEKADGKMYAVREAACGDAVKIYLNDDASLIDQKKATRHLSNGKEEVLNFVHIQYDGEDYWTRDIFLSGIGDGTNERYNTPGIVTSDTFAYSSPSGSSLTSTQIKEGTFVVFRENQAEGVDGFFKVVIYNGTPFGKEIYLKQETFTVNKTVREIAATFAKLNRKVENEKDRIKPEIRDEILWRLINDSGVATEGSILSAGDDAYFIEKLDAYLASDANAKSPLSEDLNEEIHRRIASYNARHM